MIRLIRRDPLVFLRTQPRIQAPTRISQQWLFTSEHDQEAVSPEAPSSPKPDSESLDNDRVFRLEGNVGTILTDIGTMKGDIGAMKGDINTLKWQIGILVTAIMGGGGTFLGYLVKEKFFGGLVGTTTQSDHTTSHGINKQQSDELELLVETAVIKAIRIAKDPESSNTKKDKKS